MTTKLSEIHPRTTPAAGLSAREVLDGMTNYTTPNKQNAKVVAQYNALLTRLGEHIALLDQGYTPVPETVVLEGHDHELALTALVNRTRGQQTPFATLQHQTEFAPTAFPDTLTA